MPELTRKCVSLGQFPTPVGLVEFPGTSGPIGVKRDDLTARPYGGNKVRKLEFLLADAEAQGHKRVATVGALGSNHVLATAIYGRARGFAVTAILFPQLETEAVRHKLSLLKKLDVKIIFTRGRWDIPWKVWSHRRSREHYWIPAGGSSPVGALGYVRCGQEISQQVARGELPSPDLIYVALGTGGTCAGLLAGLQLPRPPKIIGVRVVDRIVANRSRVMRLATTAAREVGRSLDELAEFSIDHRFFAGGYARSNRAIDAAVNLSRERGLDLESTYSGKAMAALLFDATAGVHKDKNVLFVNTYAKPPESL